MVSKKYLLNIQLIDSAPRIWRSFYVHGSITFYKLHHIIQIVMGWENYHLFCFIVNDQTIELKSRDYPMSEGAIDCENITLQELVSAHTKEFFYEYDFGDSWLHVITVVEIDSAPEYISPGCIMGENNCPPEDVGGIHGYYRFLKQIFFENHDKMEYNWREWIAEKKVCHPEGYMPLRFDEHAVNEELANIDVYIANWEQAPGLN